MSRTRYQIDCSCGASFGPSDHAWRVDLASWWHDVTALPALRGKHHEAERRTRRALGLSPHPRDMRDESFAEATARLQHAVDDLRFAMARLVVTSWWWRAWRRLAGKRIR